MSSSRTPFKGILFSISGIYDQKRKDICKYVVKLGGNITDELLKVTQVLIIGDDLIRTNKYRYCVRHRPDIIFIDWKIILELYELWKRGEDITHNYRFKNMENDPQSRMLHLLRNDYSDLPLSKFYIFIGRIPSKKHTIEDLEAICNKLGCKHIDSKTLDTTVLTKRDQYDIIFISGESNSTRQRAAVRFNIPIIHYKWILDCNKRNAILEYDPYYLIENVQDKSYDDIGIDSCDCWDTLEKINQVIISSKEIQTQSIQTDLILKKYKPRGGKLWNKVMSNSVSEDGQNTGQRQQLVLSKSKYIENHIYTEHNDNNPTGTNRVYDSGLVNENRSKDLQEKLHNDLIFDNCSFSIHESFPSKHQRILINVIKKNGGTIVTSIHTDPNYLIVPSNIPLEALDLPQSSASDIYMVTEFFIERCLHYKLLINPPDTWSKPFYFTDSFHLIPNPKILHRREKDHSSLTVAITGFQGVELLHLTKILAILENKGIKYTEYVNKNIDLLLLNLSALNSINEDYILWTNNYKDLFQLNKKYLKNDADSQAAVFRNSLKRKLGFVKQVGTIPVATPAFVMEIFRKTSHFLYNPDYSNNFVRINDTNWCIFCPKNDSNSYEISIKRGIITSSEQDKSSPIKETTRKRPNLSESRSYKICKTIFNEMNSPSKLSNPHSPPNTIKNSFKESTKEAMSKFREPRRLSHSNPKSSVSNGPLVLQLDNIPNLSRSPSKLDSNIKVTDFKIERPRIDNDRVNKVERSLSWGAMLSSSQYNLSKEDNPDTSFSVSDKEENQMNDTQIVYGTGDAHHNKKTHDTPRRPLTRNQAKNLEL